MPRVPSVGLSPTSRPQFQAPQVVAFQGGPELQQIAQGGARMQRIGEVVNQIGLEIEDKVNDARAMEAVNTFENGASKAFLEYQQKKGKDGVDAYEDYQKQIQELQDGAGGMLMNEQQRALASQAFSKINSRFNLRGQEHYIETAAQYKQAQNIANQAVLRDNMIANPSDPQALVDFSRFNNLVLEEGRAQGLDEEALQVFAMGKRDELFQAIVTAGLDSEDPARIQGVEALMAALPDGVISQTQSEALTNLVREKSVQSNAFAWASQSFQSGKTPQEALQEIDELAATDPETAQARLRAFETRFNAGKKVELAERAELQQTLSDKIYQGQPLTAAEKEQARSRGIAFDLEKFQNDVESERDQTTAAGKEVYASLLNNIPALMDIGSGAEVFAYARSKGMSYSDATTLAGQRNRYSEDTTAGRNYRGKSSSSRIEFDVFDTDEDQVVETSLFQLDAKHAKQNNIMPYRSRVAMPYGGDTTQSNYALRMMVNKFKLDVMDVANSILAQVPEGEKVNRNEILQQASKVVYERGWSNEDHTVNRYTTEYRFLPEVPEDVLAMMPQAREDLREQQRNETVQRALAGDPRMLQAGGLIVQQQFLDQAAMANVLDPTVARALGSAMRDASLVEATSTISEADVQARAQVLVDQDRERKRLQSEENRQVAHRDIARSLLELEVDDLKATYIATDIRGREVERSVGRDPVVQARIRTGKFLNLPAVRDLRKKWAETALDENWEEEFNAFALQFYPGPKRDEKYFPNQTKALLKNLPRSSDAPGESLNRFDALKQRYGIN